MSDADDSSVVSLSSETPASTLVYKSRKAFFVSSSNLAIHKLIALSLSEKILYAFAMWSSLLVEITSSIASS